MEDEIAAMKATILRLEKELSSALSAWGKDEKELKKTKQWRDYYKFKFEAERKISGNPERPTQFSEWLEKYANLERYK